VQCPASLYCLVYRQRLEQFRTSFLQDRDTRRIVWRIGVILDVEDIKKRVGGMGVMSAEWLKTELPMHEDDCISGFEEILGGCCATVSCFFLIHLFSQGDEGDLMRTSTKVVKKSHTVFSSKWGYDATDKIRFLARVVELNCSHIEL
jgi:hypothetical protein